MRIRFLKKGMQREFLVRVIEKLRVKSLRGLLQFGFDVKYSTLKNYYIEKRLMPEELFLDLCEVSGINESRIERIDENWGRVVGGLSFGNSS